jgi:hypothetical protein
MTKRIIWNGFKLSEEWGHTYTLDNIGQNSQVAEEIKPM